MTAQTSNLLRSVTLGTSNSFDFGFLICRRFVSSCAEETNASHFSPARQVCGVGRAPVAESVRLLSVSGTVLDCLGLSNHTKVFLSVFYR